MFDKPVYFRFAAASAIVLTGSLLGTYPARSLEVSLGGLADVSVGGNGSGGLGVGVDVGGSGGISADVSAGGGSGLGVGASVGGSNGINADVSAAAGSGVNVGASVGGASGVNAGVSLSGSTGLGVDLTVGSTSGTSGTSSSGTSSSGTTSGTPVTPVTMPTPGEIAAAKRLVCHVTGNSTVYNGDVVFGSGGRPIGVVHAAWVDAGLKITRITFATLPHFVSPAYCVTIDVGKVRLGHDALMLAQPADEIRSVIVASR